MNCLETTRGPATVSLPGVVVWWTWSFPLDEPFRDNRCKRVECWVQCLFYKVREHVAQVGVILYILNDGSCHLDFKYNQNESVIALCLFDEIKDKIKVILYEDAIDGDDSRALDDTLSCGLRHWFDGGNHNVRASTKLFDVESKVYVGIQEGFIFHSDHRFTVHRGWCRLWQWRHKSIRPIGSVVA